LNLQIRNLIPQTEVTAEIVLLIQRTRRFEMLRVQPTAKIAVIVTHTHSQAPLVAT